MNEHEKSFIQYKKILFSLYKINISSKRNLISWIIRKKISFLSFIIDYNLNSILFSNNDFHITRFMIWIKYINRYSSRQILFYLSNSIINIQRNILCKIQSYNQSFTSIRLSGYWSRTSRDTAAHGLSLIICQ